MKKWKDIIHHTTFRLLDHSNLHLFQQEPYTAITSFAIDDMLALSVSDGCSPPAVRLWVHADTIVLGIPDARLPFIGEGIQFLADEGYHVVVRNSGGLAVNLDRGVLNISLVLPGVKHITIYECYEAMVSFVKYMLRDLTDEIEAYEIVGSYCPGDYDLSIQGKKFAGISQRRIKDGAAIQIYLDICGDSNKRATAIKQFYAISKKEEKTNFNFPTVDPNVMASLSELLGTTLTVEAMKSRVYNALESFSSQIIEQDFTADELATFEKRLLQMEKRNETIANMQ
jgi:octanoyl-[GcvH]:protein N-octanoyltransferase/lipoyl amidotransferase